MAINKNHKQIADSLKLLEPGFLPYPIFKEIARLVVMPIIEFVPLRLNNGIVEVLLIDRPDNDDIWPGEKHTPGTVLRATDLNGDMHGGFDRILNDELDKTRVSSPYFVGSLFHQGKRGVEHAQIYWVEVLESPKVGKFYLADKLPPETMGQQRKFIAQAVKSFINFKQN